MELSTKGQSILEKYMIEYGKGKNAYTNLVTSLTEENLGKEENKAITERAVRYSKFKDSKFSFFLSEKKLVKKLLGKVPKNGTKYSRHVSFNSYKKGSA